jgi:hypothetical protein
MTIANPQIEKVIHPLTKAIADEVMRKKMDIEDEFDREYQELENKYGHIIEQKNQELEQKDREIAALKKLLENKK